ncbi:hypothetical protein ACJX0J_027964, partial [Zea mays]
MHGDSIKYQSPLEDTQLLGNYILMECPIFFLCFLYTENAKNFQQLPKVEWWLYHTTAGASINEL